MSIFIIILILCLSNSPGSNSYSTNRYVAATPGCRCIPRILQCNYIGFHVGFSLGRRAPTCLPGLFMCCDGAVLSRSGTRDDHLLTSIFNKIFNPSVTNNGLRRSGVDKVLNRINISSDSGSSIDLLAIYENIINQDIERNDISTDKTDTYESATSPNIEDATDNAAVIPPHQSISTTSNTTSVGTAGINNPPTVKNNKGRDNIEQFHMPTQSNEIYRNSGNEDENIKKHDTHLKTTEPHRSSLSNKEIQNANMHLLNITATSKKEDLYLQMLPYFTTKIIPQSVNPDRKSRIAHLTNPTKEPHLKVQNAFVKAEEQNVTKYYGLPGDDRLGEEQILTEHLDLSKENNKSSTSSDTPGVISLNDQHLYILARSEKVDNFHMSNISTNLNATGVHIFDILLGNMSHINLTHPHINPISPPSSSKVNENLAPLGPILESFNANYSSRPPLIEGYSMEKNQTSPNPEIQTPPPSSPTQIIHSGNTSIGLAKDESISNDNLKSKGTIISVTSQDNTRRSDIVDLEDDDTGNMNTSQIYIGLQELDDREIFPKIANTSNASRNNMNDPPMEANAGANLEIMDFLEFSTETVIPQYPAGENIEMENSTAESYPVVDSYTLDYITGENNIGNGTIHQKVEIEGVEGEVSSERPMSGEETTESFDGLELTTSDFLGNTFIKEAYLLPEDIEDNILSAEVTPSEELLMTQSKKNDSTNTNVTTEYAYDFDASTKKQFMEDLNTDDMINDTIGIEVAYTQHAVLKYLENTTNRTTVDPISPISTQNFSTEYVTHKNITGVTSEMLENKQHTNATINNTTHGNDNFTFSLDSSQNQTTESETRPHGNTNFQNDAHSESTLMNNILVATTFASHSTVNDFTTPSSDRVPEVVNMHDDDIKSIETGNQKMYKDNETTISTPQSYETPKMLNRTVNTSINNNNYTTTPRYIEAVAETITDNNYVTNIESETITAQTEPAINDPNAQNPDEMRAQLSKSNAPLSIADIIRSLGFGQNSESTKIHYHDSQPSKDNYLDAIHVNSDMSTDEVTEVPKRKVDKAPTIFGWLFG